MNLKNKLQPISFTIEPIHEENIRKIDFVFDFSKVDLVDICGTLLLLKYFTVYLHVVLTLISYSHGATLPVTHLTQQTTPREISFSHDVYSPHFLETHSTL